MDQDQSARYHRSQNFFTNFKIENNIQIFREIDYDQ